MKFYQYEKCESCRKAKKWLDERGVSFSSIAIRENPPSKNELKEMLVSHDGNLKKLFNTSSKDYRDIAVDYKGREARHYKMLHDVIQKGCRTAIKIAEKI